MPLSLAWPSKILAINSCFRRPTGVSSFKSRPIFWSSAIVNLERTVKSICLSFGLGRRTSSAGGWPLEGVGGFGDDGFSWFKFSIGIGFLGTRVRSLNCEDYTWRKFYVKPFLADRNERHGAKKDQIG